MANIPIALFAYTRPDHLRQTLDGLRKNNVPLIYAFSDGPKDETVIDKVGEVRQILHNVNWCDIRVVEQEKNLGLGPSIRSGVTQVLEKHDSVIVVEDDIVFRPGAYDCTLAAMEQYQDHPEVMTVSMWSHPSLVPSGKDIGFFSKRFLCWGWATYRTAWQKFQGTPKQLYADCTARNINVLEWGEDIRWQVDHAAELKLWAVGFLLTHFIHNGLTYVPCESLTENIGCDGSGMNSGRSSRGLPARDLLGQAVPIPKNWPQVTIVPGLENAFRTFYQPHRKSAVSRIRGRLGLLKRHLLNLP